jgi:hypothetical protein
MRLMLSQIQEGSSSCLFLLYFKEAIKFNKIVIPPGILFSSIFLFYNLIFIRFEMPYSIYIL